MDLNRSLGLFRKSKIRIIAKFLRTDLVICSHSREGENPSYIQINMAIRVLPFLNNPKCLDPSYKMDLDFRDSFGRKKLCLIAEEMSYSRRNMVETM